MRKLWFVTATLAVVTGHLYGCGAPTPRRYPLQGGGGRADAGDGTGGMAPETIDPGTGGKATGGSTGGRGGAGTGGSVGTGGAVSTGGVFGDPADAAPDTGGAGGSQT